MIDSKEIEKSIIKKYRKTIWSKFVHAVCEYNLIEENDKIMVCISGGKDSFLLAKCIQELIRHGKIKFDACFVVMNPGYSKENMDLILKNAEILDIPLKVFNTDIFNIVNNNTTSPCYLCARMRRGYLYNEAKKMGCNKIALGHHLDDVIETILLSMFYGSEIKTMLPKLRSSNFEGLELIRPLYLIKESDIISWKNNSLINFINCACKFTEEQKFSDKEKSKRKEIKKLINDLRKINLNIDHNLFKSIGNVNLDAILGYRKDHILHTYLEEYNKKNNSN